MSTATGKVTRNSDDDFLLGYIADLELEIDRLRKQGHFVRNTVRDVLKKLHALSDAAGVEQAESVFHRIREEIGGLAEVMRDLQESPGYHPVHDQVIAIPIRPVADQVFRWQQRLENASAVTMKMELDCEHIDWFPARLRHILDNLFAFALKNRDPGKQESWVGLRLVTETNSYHLEVFDNGNGPPLPTGDDLSGLLFRRVLGRTANGGADVGLAVVKLLVEQSGGALRLETREGRGTSIMVILPRYEIDDFIS